MNPEGPRTASLEYTRSTAGKTKKNLAPTRQETTNSPVLSSNVQRIMRAHRREFINIENSILVGPYKTKG